MMTISNLREKKNYLQKYSLRHTCPANRSAFSRHRKSLAQQLAKLKEVGQGFTDIAERNRATKHAPSYNRTFIRLSTAKGVLMV